MRRFLGGMALVVVLLTRAPAAGQELLHQTFGTYLEALRVQSGVPGLSAAIVGAHNVVWERTFGLQDVAQALPVRTDTLFHLDGLTQLVTASLVLRCAEDGQVFLDDPIGRFAPQSVHAGLTIRQVLSHTEPVGDGLAFSYRPDRYDALGEVLTACLGDSLLASFGQWLDRMGMTETIPGPDAIFALPTLAFDPPVARYGELLERVAVPYVVTEGRASATEHPSTTLTPTAGLLSTVRDVARFDLALKNGLLLSEGSRASAWSFAVGPEGDLLPHGLGWWLDTYNQELVVWQFGLAERASSSLMITIPSRALTLILMANSEDLAKPFVVEDRDLTSSPFARLFLELFGLVGTR